MYWQSVTKLDPSGPVAQWLEQGTHNPLVGSSNLSGPIFLFLPADRRVLSSLLQYKSLKSALTWIAARPPYCIKRKVL